MRREVYRRFDRRIVEIDGGWRDLITDRQDRKDRLNRAGGAEQMANARLGRRHRDAGGNIANQTLHRAELDFIAKWGRSTVRVDVVNVAHRDTGPLNRHAHATEGGGAPRARPGGGVPATA